MNLADLLGWPLDEALGAARAEGLRVDGVVETGARESGRAASGREAHLEKRVVACRGNTLIAASFRTGQPEGKPGKGPENE